jgi:aerobic carbon-monoxide dehydrogenase small subunit
VITETKPATHQIAVTVNGAEHSLEVEPRLLLVHMLREKLGLTGTHVGCDTTSCGACTVLVGGVPIKSCTHFAVQVDGREVKTVEGLKQGADLHRSRLASRKSTACSAGSARRG